MIVTFVPPLYEPHRVDTVLIAGGATNVKPPPLTSPTGVVTAIEYAPAVLARVWIVTIVPVELIETDCAVPPIVAVAPNRFVPVTLTDGTALGRARTRAHRADRRCALVTESRVRVDCARPVIGRHGDVERTRRVRGCGHGDLRSAVVDGNVGAGDAAEAHARVPGEADTGDA